MRKHLLKQLTLALLLTAAVPTLNAQVHVGDILCEGNLIYPPSIYPSSGATAIGVVFYVDDTGQHGWALALQDVGSYKWGCRNNDTPLPNYTNVRQAMYDFDGYENTHVVREHNTAHPAFYAVDFDNGWYVPAIGQLNYLYGNIIEVNTGLTAAGGSTVSSTNSSWSYWSSTEYGSTEAWSLIPSGQLYYDLDHHNYPEYNNKNKSRQVRAVRNF